MFDPSKTYKFRHLQNSGLVRDREDLKRKQEFGFPLGRLLTPRDRQWTGEDLNTYLDSRPTTQAELDALPNRPEKTKPEIAKPKEARPRRRVALEDA
jgi:hypothetical protein